MVQLQLTQLKQIAPFTPTTAQVQVDFQILGILPDLVQIYAAGVGDSG